MAVVSLTFTALLWYASYSGYELRYVPGRQRCWVSAHLIDGVVSLQLGYSDLPAVLLAGNRATVWEYKPTKIQLREHPFLIQVTPSKLTAWGGITNYSLRIDALASFLFVVFGIIPVAGLIVIPMLRKSGRIDPLMLGGTGVQKDEQSRQKDHRNTHSE